MKKRVLHVINSLTTGGAEILLANSLSAGGLQEHTDNYLVYFAKTSGLQNIVDINVKIICLHYKGGADIFRLLRQLRRIIKDNKIEIIHSHLTPAGFYIEMVRPSSVSHVHTIHSTYSMDNETRPFFRFLNRYFYFNKKKCNIISLSDFTRNDFLQAVPFKGKIFVLNNFVADKYFTGDTKKYESSNQVLRIVAAGSLKELKNFEYLLSVFSHLCNYEIYLDIYGNGDKAKYEQVIKDGNLKVRMMGHQNDMAAVYSKYDLFIMPSKFEGYPLAVFEAMASGVPLMLSNIAPLRSIVQEHAIYFDLDNAVQTAEILLKIFNNQVDINNMAEQAKAYAQKKVKREMYIRSLLQIYQQIN